MAHVQFAVASRAETGSAAARRIRRQGLVPGIVYQSDAPNIAITANAREVRRLLHGEGARTSVIDLKVDGGAPRPVLVKDWQVDPVRDEVIHIDLQQVDLSVEVEAAVPVSLTGTPVGVREGGVLDQQLREVTVRALPDHLPDVIEIDVSELDAGTTVTVADLTAPEGVVILDDPEAGVASVIAPTGELPEEEEGEPSEPELVGGRESEEE